VTIGACVGLRAAGETPPGVRVSFLDVLPDHRSGPMTISTAVPACESLPDARGSHP